MEDYDFDLDEPENKSKGLIHTTMIKEDSDSDILENEGAIKTQNTIEHNQSTQISRQHAYDFSSINPKAFNSVLFSNSYSTGPPKSQMKFKTNNTKFMRLHKPRCRDSSSDGERSDLFSELADGSPMPANEL